jgi:PAS domain S-box-containing protein
MGRAWRYPSMVDATPLAEFLQRERERILVDWEAAVRTLPKASQLDRPSLRDSIPDLIDRMAASALGLGAPASGGSAPRVHAVARLAEGFDLEEVVAEYTVLRAIIVRRLLASAQPMVARMHELLHRCIDEAIAEAVAQYHASRSRTLQALDRIATAALAEGADMDVFLAGLLRVLLDSCPSADTAAVLLLENGMLRVRAVVGLEQDLEIEGFAGTILAERRPLHLSEAHSDPRGRGSALRALFGVPLLHGGELVGVAHVGSLTVPAFSDDDQLLFRTAAQRAASLIRQAQITFQLQETRERLRLAMLAGGVGTWRVDPATSQVTRDASLSGMLGLDEREATEPMRDFMARVHPDDRDTLLGRTREAMAGRGSYEAEYRVVRPDASVRWLRDRGRWFADDGRGAFMTGAVADITAIREVERERELFIGILGHDLRTPLHSMRMAADLLVRRGALAPNDAKVVQRVTSSARRMSVMVDDLLDFARARLGGGIPIEPHPMDVAALCRSVIEEHEAARPGRVITLGVEGDAVGDWDADRLVQALANLLDNALTHGAIDAPVTVTVEDLGERVRVAVHNQGRAIPSVMMAHIFDPFVRGDGVRRSTGLGLYIVRQIALAHGGVVTVESSDQGGTTFAMVLPRRRARVRS